MSFNNISFILHQPQLSENIGACARAIKNFNFKKLVIINPKPVFPNDKILATSVGAKDIIINSKVHNQLESAVKKVDYLIATTSRFRNKNIQHIKLNELNKIDFSKKIAFLFGSEASGLSNNEVSYANYTMQIPTNPNFKSLNLSHSVIIVAQVVASLIKFKSLKYIWNQNLRRTIFIKEKWYIEVIKKYLEKAIISNEIVSIDTSAMAIILSGLSRDLDKKYLKKEDKMIPSNALHKIIEVIFKGLKITE